MTNLDKKPIEQDVDRVEKRAAALAKGPGVDCLARAVTEAIGQNA